MGRGRGWISAGCGSGWSRSFLGVHLVRDDEVGRRNRGPSPALSSVVVVCLSRRAQVLLVNKSYAMVSVLSSSEPRSLPTEWGLLAVDATQWAFCLFGSC
jgi:hypothetical protein